MKFKPKSDREIAEDGLFPKGEYDFEIIDGEDTSSKTSGADMIALKLKVFNENGRSTLVNDYLLEKIMYKLKHAAEACGLLEDYENGTLEGDDFIGKTGRCKLVIQEDKSGNYPPRNSIQDYIVPKPGSEAVVKAVTRSVAAAATRKPIMEEIDDEIPF